MLCVGPSGAGKTTLAVLMALHGGCLRSDDTTLVGESGVWPMAQQVRIDPRSLISRPDLASTLTIGRKGDLATVHPKGGTLTPAVLLFPSIGASGGLSLKPIGPGEALHGLLSASPFATEDRLGDPRPHLQTLSFLANGAVSYRVNSGPELLQDPERWLAQLP